MMTAMALHSRTSTSDLLRAGTRNRIRPRRAKRNPAIGAGRPGNKAVAGRWERKINWSKAVRPTPTRYSPQTTAPIANTKRPPTRTGRPLVREESIHKAHPITRYASDDHGAMRVGLATWPAAKSPRKASAVRAMTAAVALPNKWIFMPVRQSLPDVLWLISYQSHLASSNQDRLQRRRDVKGASVQRAHCTRCGFISDLRRQQER